ncbi:MAG: hypothetical protein ACREQ9_07480 [Candidatus Binatia bacterium]
MSEDATKEREREKLERRVEDLAAEIAELINTSESDERNDLRDLALSIVREEVRSGQEDSRSDAASRPERPFNPIVMGVPVFLMGAVMVILFPPVGMLLFAVSFLLVGWGIVMSVFSRR